MSGPLTGKRVLDLTWGISGPLATMLMADYGADVIRIEAPDGDPFSVHPGYVVWNRGKRGMTLDLRKPEGLATFKRLLPTVDALVESFQPGVADRLGIGYETLHEQFPRLVYTSISAYGQQGTDRDRPGYDGLVQARLGMQHDQVGFRDGPIYVGWAMPSYSTAFLALIGTLTAIYVRLSTGRGQHVDTSLRDGALAMLTMWWSQAEKGQERFATPIWVKKLLVELFECSDGEWLHLHTGAQGAYDRFVVGIDMPHLADQPQTEEMWIGMFETATNWFKSHTREEALAMLLRQDIPSLPVNPPGGALRDPQSQVMKFVETVHDPRLGDIDEIGLSVRFEKTPGEIRSSAPDPSQHTDDVLTEAGLSSDEIEKLRQSSTIR